MNGLGTSYITDTGLNYFIRAISGLDTTKITQGAVGTGSPTGGATEVGLTTEVERDTSVVTWDGTNKGPIFTTSHAPATDVTHAECGLFTSGNIMPFYYVGYVAGEVKGATLGDTLVTTMTLAFADSSE